MTVGDTLVYDALGGYVDTTPEESDWTYLAHPLAFLRSIYDAAGLFAVECDYEKPGGSPLLTALVWVAVGGVTDWVAVQWSSWHAPTIYEATCGWREYHDGWTQFSYAPTPTRGLDELFLSGTIVQVHSVNGYEVIEYMDRPAVNEERTEPERCFMVEQVDGRRVGHIYRELDKALLACMYCRAAIGEGRDYLNSSWGAVDFAWRGLRLGGEA